MGRKEQGKPSFLNPDSQGLQEDRNGAHWLKNEVPSVEEARARRFRRYAPPLYLLFLVFASATATMGKAYPSGDLPLQLIGMQAVFTGIATGKLAENSLSAGAKHAPALFIIGAIPYLLVSLL